MRSELILFSKVNYIVLWCLTLSTEKATSLESTKSRNSDSSVSRGTNSHWGFGLMWICTERFAFLELVDFGDVAFWKLSWENEKCADFTLKSQHTATHCNTPQHTAKHCQTPARLRLTQLEDSLKSQLHSHCTLKCQRHGHSVPYRVAKTHRMPFLHRSFSAKGPYN